MTKAMHEDKLLRKIEEWKEGDAARASDAGEQREDIGQFIEFTGWNKKALSWIRALDKMDTDKRDDVFRSFDDLRGIMEKRWNGQSTPDMFNESEPGEEPSEPVEPFDPEKDDFNAALDDALEGRVVNFAAAE